MTGQSSGGINHWRLRPRVCIERLARDTLRQDLSNGIRPKNFNKCRITDSYRYGNGLCLSCIALACPGLRIQGGNGMSSAETRAEIAGNIVRCGKDNSRIPLLHTAYPHSEIEDSYHYGTGTG